jgi:hypothetical protein
MAKYANRNEVYLDVRDEHNRALNAAQNESPELLVSEGSTGTMQRRRYEDRGWPLLTLEASVFSAQASIDDARSMGLALPTGDNVAPVLYLWRAYTRSSYPRHATRGEQYLALDPRAPGTGQMAEFTNEVELLVPFQGIAPVSTYLRLKLCRGFDWLSTPGSLRSRTYLDNLFAPFEMGISAGGAGGYRTRVYEEQAYVDDPREWGYGMTVAVGMATDEAGVTLFAYPTNRHVEPGAIQDGLFSLTGERSDQGGGFLSVLADHRRDLELEHGELTLASGEHVPYLRLAQGGAGLSGTTFAPDLGELVTLSLTWAEWQQLETRASDAAFAPYRVYLGATLRDAGRDAGGRRYRAYELLLRGYAPQNGGLVVKEVPTEIVLYQRLSDV